MSYILQSSVITRCFKASEVLATHAAQKPILVEPAGNLVRATGRYQHECQMRMNVKQHSRIIAILNKFPPFLTSLAQKMSGSGGRPCPPAQTFSLFSLDSSFVYNNFD